MIRKITIIAVSVLPMYALRGSLSARDRGVASGKSTAPGGQTGGTTGRNWALGPFVKLRNPILRPNPNATFLCPVSGRSVKWEEQNVYNPAAVVRDGKLRCEVPLPSRTTITLVGH